MWKNRVLYLLLLIGAVVYFIDHNGWVSWYLLVLTLCLPWLSLICSLPLIWKRRIKGMVNRTCRRNEENEIEFSLVKKRRIADPICKITVETVDRLDGKGTRERVFLSGNSKCAFSVPTEHSGVYEFRVVKGYVYDLLGLFRFRIGLPKPCLTMVEPVAVGPQQHPDFSGFQAKSFKPKAGGGYSEIHEIREYRPGDPLKNIHWKLSAKTDNLMIREPQEPDSKLVMVTVELTADREKLDGVLDELRWVSEHLLEMEVSHDVCYMAGDERRVRPVSCSKELQDIFRDMMSHPVKSGMSVIRGAGFPRADWHYHIDPYRKGDGDDRS